MKSSSQSSPPNNNTARSPDDAYSLVVYNPRPHPSMTVFGSRNTSLRDYYFPKD